MSNKKIIIYFLFLLLLSFCIFEYYVSTHYFTFETFNHDKTLYLVWTDQIMEGIGGIGDKIRGAIATHQYCRENKVRLVIDGTKNICSKFLKNLNSNEYEVIKDQHIIYIKHVDHGNFDGFQDNLNRLLTDQNEIFIDTNFRPINEDSGSYNKDILSLDDKNFAKHLCEPTDQLKQECNEKIANLPPNYGIVHFRFDDGVFTEDITELNPEFMHFFNILKDNYTPTDVLLSNSTNFKKYAKQYLQIRTIECNHQECEVEHVATSNDYAKIKNSFVEFCILANAKYIKTKSHYGWISNFAKWPALIYDIPFYTI